jgi:hypothetical protein
LTIAIGCGRAGDSGCWLRDYEIRISEEGGKIEEKDREQKYRGEGRIAKKKEKEESK